MLIYRVENSFGTGPYRDPHYANWDPECSHDGDPNRPTPKTEGIAYDYDMLCAFNSKTQLKRWFTPKERKALSELGFNVYVYDVNKKYCIKGKKQLVFHKKYAILVEVLHIGDLNVIKECTSMDAKRSR